MGRTQLRFNARSRPPFCFLSAASSDLWISLPRCSIYCVKAPVQAPSLRKQEAPSRDSIWVVIFAGLSGPRLRPRERRA
ncbi:hypothetical protein NDU88_005180 [Pleurodeles waltl]|uniref:Uncharacterized protein n=1 Tax=Pleurodeles waltl TaxID=8319 RepID=A0AAV7RNJ6_PLEWA|nr:hypothetical protein NDU88_005180 [Pleurodeles waltl]